MPGPESRTWFKKVPEEDLTSLTYHCPFDCQNSQCLRETTFDLKPTGAIAEGPSAQSADELDWSLSLYLPTRTTLFAEDKVRVTAVKFNDGR
jgi:hypothetical protein